MSNNTSWLTQTVLRSRSVAPTYGFGMGDVCPQAVGVIAGTPMPSGPPRVPPDRLGVHPSHESSLIDRHLQGRGIPDKGSAAFLFLKSRGSPRDELPEAIDTHEKEVRR